MRRFALAWLVQILPLVFSPAAFCKMHDLTETLQIKQSVISGVLNPGSVSFNGQEIYNKKENFAALLINKVPVKTKTLMGLETFYVTTDENPLELDWQTKDGKTIPLLKVQYPAVTEFKTDGDRLYLSFNEAVTGARLDSKEISVHGDSVETKDFKNWIGEVHTLELQSNANSGQIYNLDFRSLRSELLTVKSLSFSIGDGPFSANVKPVAFGLSLRQLDENNVSLECGVYLSKVNYHMMAGSTLIGVAQNAGQLKGRYGYNPFTVNPGGFSFKRLTFGAQAEAIFYRLESDLPTTIDGQNSAKVELWFFRAGPFIRWEPLQHKEWGFFFNLDFGIVRTQRDIPAFGDVMTLGLSYYF